MEGFLSTFQTDLSAVAGQISELQNKSKELDERLKGRKVRLSNFLTHWAIILAQKIERPLSSLILDLCIPPPLATLLLDTAVGEPWIDAVGQLEIRLQSIKARGRVKASRDLGEIAEALRIVVRRLATLCSLTKLLTRHFQGCHETPSLLPCFTTAYSNQYEHKHAGPPDFGPPQVSAALRISSTKRSRRGQ